MIGYVLDFNEIDRTRVADVGGKGAHLTELARIPAVTVPDGFCVTTAAYRRAMSNAAAMPGALIEAQLKGLSALTADDRDAIRTLSADIRQTIEHAPIDGDIIREITAHLSRFANATAFAVRSSATAEDLPSASFAGQQDTYLNVAGTPAILEHIRRCWASLFTERAVVYRLRNGFDHRNVHMAVVVQQMIASEASGILFTADPITGNRKIASINASFGLGEALVAGLVNPDVFKVANNEIIEKSIATKTLMIAPRERGGTESRSVDLQRQQLAALTDTQALQLVNIGRQIEAHFHAPQDIEWCLVDHHFEFVQSRPITGLFPPPEVNDGENHVYLSVGHQQMMTDAMKPLGISIWQLATARPMAEAGGRLFVDVTAALAAPNSRAALLGLIGKSDPFTGSALQSILDRKDFIRFAPSDSQGAQTIDAAIIAAAQPATPIAVDPAIVTALIEKTEASIAKLEREIQGKSGSELFDLILEDVAEHKRILFDPESYKVFMSAIKATWWLNEHLLEWLGEKNAADSLAQSVPNNVTSEMGMALLVVADVIRPHASVVEFLEQTSDDNFLEALHKFEGGAASRDAIKSWLKKYGMRGAGEIDITRPRWSERPTMLVPLLLNNIRNFDAGAAQRLFQTGLDNAQKKEREILERLRTLPGGEEKAEEVKLKVDRVRTFIGYREFPKVRENLARIRVQNRTDVGSEPTGANRRVA